MKGSNNGIEFDTEKDFCFVTSTDEWVQPFRLSVGKIYKNENVFYIHGSKPIGDAYISENFERKGLRKKRFKDDAEKEEFVKEARKLVEEKYHVSRDNEDFEDLVKNVIDESTEEFTYTATEYVSFIAPTDLILLFIEDVKNTSLEISDANIFLSGEPIKAKGLMSVNLHDCFFYKEESGTLIEMDKGELKGRFVELTNGVFGAQIKNNVFNGNPKREFWPKNSEFFLKVSKQDTVINSYTDKRGYIPTSCGKDNAEKDVTIVVRDKT